MIRKFCKHCVQNTDPSNSCCDLIKSHQQCILCSPPLGIKPATTQCRAKTLPLTYRSTSHNAKSTSHGKCMAKCSSNATNNLTSKKQKVCSLCYWHAETRRRKRLKRCDLFYGGECDKPT